MQVLCKHQHRLGPALICNPDPEHHDSLIADPCLALTVRIVHIHITCLQRVTVTGRTRYSILVRVLPYTHDTSCYTSKCSTDDEPDRKPLCDCTNATSIGFDNRICIYPSGCYRR
jgi:hypothetical protein